MHGSSVTWTCPACGMVDPTPSQIYRADGVFNAQSLRVGPWCPTCGRRLLASFADLDGPLPEGATEDAPSVLLISGSCASGKTTISYLLAAQASAIQIDGDWMLHLLQEESGGKVSLQDTDRAICRMTEAFVRLGERVVIAQVVLPDTVDTYADYFRERGIRYELIVLMPSRAQILERNQTRKCWPKTTPEFWVNKFWDELAAGPEAFRAAFHDNSAESPEMTAAHIMAQCHWPAERKETVP